MNIFSWLGRKTALDQHSKAAAEQSYLLPPSSETLKNETEKDKNVGERKSDTLENNVSEVDKKKNVVIFLVCSLVFGFLILLSKST